MYVRTYGRSSHLKSTWTDDEGMQAVLLSLGLEPARELLIRLYFRLYCGSARGRTRRRPVARFRVELRLEPPREGFVVVAAGALPESPARRGVAVAALRGVARPERAQRRRRLPARGAVRVGRRRAPRVVGRGHRGHLRDRLRSAVANFT